MFGSVTLFVAIVILAMSNFVTLKKTFTSADNEFKTQVLRKIRLDKPD